MNIRQIIMDEMARQGVTQRALQEMTGVLQHRISEFLTGRRDVNAETLAKILDALDIELRPSKRSRRKGKGR